MSDIDIVGEITLATSEEAAYARTNSRIDNIIAHNNDTDGNSELADIRIGADRTVYLSAGEAVRNQFAHCKNRLDRLETETYLSTSTAVTSDETYDGYIIIYNGTMQQNQYTTNFVVNKYENVPAGKYKAHGYPQNNHCLYVVVGSDQTVIEYQKVGDTLSGSGETNYDFYVLNEGSTVYVGGTHTTSPALYKYDKAVSLKDNVAVPQIAAAQNSLNPLYGKTVTLNGDSIAYGAGCTINGSAWGFMDFIADRNNMTLDKQAVSGGCLSFKSTEASGRHYICRTIENMDENADYVIFEGGYNDWWLSHSVGSITATMTDEIDDSTVYGALESICRQALEKWKTAKIGFVITHKINDAWRTGHSSAGVTLDGYYQAIRDVCEKYSIPYIDLSRVSRLNTELESYKTFTSSSGGIHPNRTGYETFYVPAIENWMKNL